jgi:hypothetical protein
MKHKFSLALAGPLVILSTTLTMIRSVKASTSRTWSLTGS